MKKQKKQFFKAALYLRLSNQNIKDNSDESDSIVNQEALLRAYLNAHPDIEIKFVFKDDGWSGVNFNRPGFQKMMQKIYDGEVDCVVVKDMSRLGRNHTETGKYITRVFPAFGVRFIAVNDHVDSADSNSDSDNIIIPFKGLLNDSYSRDISMKVRSAKAVKNAAGDFGGGFKPYGYDIDPENENHYIIDKEAAETVKRIYSWTFDGMGSTEIVRRLNTLHILPPSEHKKKKSKKNYVPSDTKWNIYQIYRILRNDVYTGTLRLGKTTTPNYKVKKIINVPEEEQYVFENAHEPIISRQEFDLMQDVLSRDTRVNSNGGKNSYVYPLTGYVYCADCGSNMVVKTVTSKGHQYKYYVCGENKRNKSVCISHNIQLDTVNQLVLKALNTHLSVLFEAEATIDERNMDVLVQPQIEKIQIKIGHILEEKYKVNEFIKGLYRDYKDGILTEEEYTELKADYQKQMDELQEDAAKLEMEKNSRVDAEMSNMYWVKKYKKAGMLTELTRRDVITFIDRIEIKDAEHIKIRFRFGDEYKSILRKQKKEYEQEGAVVNG